VEAKKLDAVATRAERRFEDERWPPERIDF
jgi:hypothetical protein